MPSICASDVLLSMYSACCRELQNIYGHIDFTNRIFDLYKKCFSSIQIFLSG